MLPASLGDAFALAAGELGMFSAARLFCAEIHAEDGDDGVLALRGLLGDTYPVLDAVAAALLARGRLPSPSSAPLLRALGGLRRVVVVGPESWLVDHLLSGLGDGVDLGVVLDPTLPAEPSRVAANLGARAAVVAADDVIRWAGSRSGLVTAVYGCDGFRATVCAPWLRLMGPDTRTTFGALVGWNLLGPAMDAYPRWLRETSTEDFTVLLDEVEA